MTRYTPPPLLPSAPHQGGRAAPLPSVPKTPSAPPAPQPKAEQPAAVVIPDCEDDNPDVTTVLTNDASVDDIAAAAGRFRRAAQLAAGNAERGQAEANDVLEQARAEAARIIAEAEAKACPLTETATAGAKRAAQLAERSARLRKAAQVAVTAEKAQAAFQALKDERDELGAKHAELGQRRTVLGTERRDLETRLAAAREAGDLDTMTTVKARVAAIEDLNAALQARQAPMQQKMAELGTGDENFSTHPALKTLPPLAKARDEASRRRTEASHALNTAMPDRPEAVAAAELQRQAEYDSYASRARDREAASRAPARRQVILGG
ncbi:MAG TPA: hypothetical protein VHZ03_38190 [Trebonia sp.]|jgi:hypothetical protein|nr:hypothetical protein [Trebonia sp.]